MRNIAHPVELYCAEVVPRLKDTTKTLSYYCCTVPLPLYQKRTTMEAMEYSYMYYTALQTWPAYFVLGSLSPTTIFILLISIMLYQCCMNPKLTRSVKHITQWLVEQVFSVTLKKRTDSEGRKIYTVLNQMDMYAYCWLQYSI